ncbi:SDR family oxidoreductase [Actinosynnema sp. NPDC047251]|uniref:Dehydrogenase with different specificities n=1 Tax=Saccharothrix espanaensis (strain ATCC 51144 / DSM 44229 / JCM 9112 / NBRC 15066 / NRRL 15764) TaxID=1179773 RepID=K0JXB5_SACES|nr:SDR family oxidoreductase [Saccharothrix espanaensis]CCH30716.1 Dehydrogenase with different specificities [Saccharothrix espanaensis DSM 44229]
MGSRFTGRVALITGAGTGIGAATARLVVAEGGKVVLTGRRPAPLAEVAGPLGDAALALPADAADGAAMAAVVAEATERLGRIDVVVANAGGHGLGTAAETTDEGWQLALDANLTSAFVTIRAALPGLVDGGGSVVLVSSLAGLFAGPAVAGYTATKHALIGLSRSIARDYGKHGVRSNVVCPGWVRTAMADEQMDRFGESRGLSRDDAYALLTENTPLGRPADAEEVASVIAFLASSDASIVSGAIVTADAGASAVDLPTIELA